MSRNVIRALLLDLDDTLLINDMGDFAPHYFLALAAKVRSVCSPELFLDALRGATRAMWTNDGKDGTNAEVFRHDFFSRLECRPEELMALLDDFYIHDFDALRQYTAVDPDARILVSLARERSYQLAIATQPIFPLVAIEARLNWAEVSHDEFHYDVIASYEVMSACKPHPHYFSTLFERLGRLPAECLMVGDSVDADMAARRFGCKTFWVDRGHGARPGRGACHAQGSLHDLIQLVETGGIDDL